MSGIPCLACFHCKTIVIYSVELCSYIISMFPTMAKPDKPVIFSSVFHLIACHWHHIPFIPSSCCNFWETGVTPDDTRKSAT